MWILWLTCAVLIVVAMVLLIKPLFKTYSDSDMAGKQKKADQRKQLNIELYQQKKAQIKQDFANGLLDEEALAQAQNEIEHSLLQDTAGIASKELTQLSSRAAKNLALSFLIFIPAFSAITYYFIMPENFEQVVLAKPQKQSHTAGSAKQVPDIAEMVKSLENKLKARPENALGWSMLGRSYVVLKRYADATIAYEKALDLVKQGKAEGPMPELEIDYVEALMQVGEKQSYQKAQNKLTEMLAANPDNGDALWFMGFLDYDAGNKDMAIERWTHLLTLLPANSEQANVVNTYLNQVKGVASQTDTKPVPKAEPAAQKGPAPGQQLTGSADEKAFIASMVARVEQRVKDNPEDLKGWQSLGKSYAVLKRNTDSANAYAKAVALDGGKDVNLLMTYVDAVRKTGQMEQLEKARIVLAQIIDKDSSNLDALFLGGSLARTAEDNQEAKVLWEMLLPQLEQGTDAYNNVERNLKSL